MESVAAAGRLQEVKHFAIVFNSAGQVLLAAISRAHNQMIAVHTCRHLGAGGKGKDEKKRETEGQKEEKKKCQGR